MARPSTKGLLKEILSEDIERVYISISEKAVEWAIASFIDEANNLLEQLWSYNISHSNHLWLSDEGLQILWEISKKQPINIPFQFKEIVEIENENWSRNFQNVWSNSYTDKFISKPIEELEGQELFVKAIISTYEETENLDKVLQILKRYIENIKPVGYSFFHATTCASLIATRLDNEEEANFFITLWGEGYQKYWANYSLCYLMRDRRCAAYLMKGVLAPVFKLTKELIKEETEEILNTLSQRILNGRALVYKHLSWKELLDKISKIAISQKTIDFSKDILTNNSLNKISATNEKISAEEKRLNILLPNDYKEFLLASNGFECFSSTGVTLSPIEEIDFLINVDKELIDIWSNSMDEVDTTIGEKLRSCLIIGGHGEEQQLFLVPLQNKQWECWHFSSWRPGETIYESFRFYMEYELQSLEDNLFVD